MTEPFYYITVEPNSGGLAPKKRWWQRARKFRNLSVIITDAEYPFYNVRTWFTPVEAQRNPDDPRYWNLPQPFKILWKVLSKGRYRINAEIPPGDYFIESNCEDKDGKSLFFVERLQIYEIPIIEPNGGHGFARYDLKTVVDVYKNGNELVFHTEYPAEPAKAA